MDRVIRIDPELLRAAQRLTPEERLRQANAAFRLYHQLHQPFARPFAKGFDTFEELARFEKENRLPR